jgi:glutamate carboxypeptidase
VRWRKASSNFVAVIHGRAAHAGRDLQAGRNAIEIASELVLNLRSLCDPAKEIGINIGHIKGGGPLNVVPALATIGFNIRSSNDADQRQAVGKAKEFVESVNDRDGMRSAFHTLVACPAKPPTEASEKLLESIQDCGRILGVQLPTRSSGGVSDGNRLAAAGLPNIDNLGVRGGDIHSNKEFMQTDSLAERAKLTALLIARLAAGEFSWPG